MEDEQNPIDCPHPFEYYDKENGLCMGCGVYIPNFIDHNAVTYNNDNPSLIPLTVPPPSTSGVKKYENKQKKIEQLKLIQSPDFRTLTPEQQKIIKTTTSSEKKVRKKIDEKFVIKNMAEKYFEIKNPKYNFKENNFENFFIIYDKMILQDQNFDFIMGNKFYLSKESIIKYNKPCITFKDTCKDKLPITKEECIAKLSDKGYLNSIYTKYKEYYSTLTISPTSTKKRNKLKTYIECFAVCLYIHYFLFHSHSKDTSKIVDKCLGVIYNEDGSLSHKKKKMKSHIIGLIDMFGINEITMQTHLLDFINFISIKSR